MILSLMTGACAKKDGCFESVAACEVAARFKSFRGSCLTYGRSQGVVDCAMSCAFVNWMASARKRRCFCCIGWMDGLSGLTGLSGGEKSAQ